MSDNWAFQLSAKIDGQHLVNVRAEDAVTFKDLLAWTKEHADDIREAALALQGTQKPAAAPPPVSVGVAQQTRVQAPAGEVGPVQVKGVQKAILKKDGTRMKSPRFTVEFSNGKRHSTFDETVAGAAETLAGESVYYTVDDSEYHNLTSVRRAA